MKFKLPVALAVLAVLGLTGCEQMPLASQRQRPVAVGPTLGVKATPPPPAATKIVTADTTSGGIRLMKTFPPEAGPGSEFVGEISVTAQRPITNVFVRDSVPVGATYLRSEPAATVEAGELVWRLGNLNPAQGVKIKLWLRAEQSLVPSSVATVNVEGRLAASVYAGKPMLALERGGPETALLGAEIAYPIMVRNVGSVVVRSVTINSTVPAGMGHSSGKSEVIQEVGDLSPGQAKSYTVTFKANQRGKACGTATVTSTNTPKVSKEVCTLILVPGLKVEKTGTKEQIIGRNADYEILVTNPGDTTLNNVLISDVTPAECSIVAAPGATISGNKATWTIAELKPGAKATETIKLTAKSAGASCNTVTVTGGGVSDSAKACTLWKGIPAVTFELADQPDPIQIGESTTYTIKVLNQGSGEIHNVKVAGTFDELLVPINSPQGTVSGQRVTFPTVAAIGPKQSVTYTIIVKGTNTGDSRSKVELTCDELKTPVIREESTNIY